MAFEESVKKRAQELDPECWVSYSGMPKAVKQYRDGRRTATLKQAQKEYDQAQIEEGRAERENEIIINETDQRRRERRATPIYLKIEPPPTQEQIELLMAEFQKALIDALTVDEKIPYNDAGTERVQKMFMEAYNRVLPNYISISVTIQK